MWALNCTFFAVTKSLSILNIAIDCFGLRFISQCDKYVDLFLENMHTGYAEVRPWTYLSCANADDTSGIGPAANLTQFACSYVYSMVSHISICKCIPRGMRQEIWSATHSVRTYDQIHELLFIPIQWRQILGANNADQRRTHQTSRSSFTSPSDQSVTLRQSGINM